MQPRIETITKLFTQDEVTHLLKKCLVNHFVHTSIRPHSQIQYVILCEYILTAAFQMPMSGILLWNAA